MLSFNQSQANGFYFAKTENVAIRISGFGYSWQAEITHRWTGEKLMDKSFHLTNHQPGRQTLKDAFARCNEFVFDNPQYK